jgi:hypothetical protein
MEKFLLDENIPPAIGDFLREKGFDVEDVWGLGKSGATDEDLIAIASEQERISSFLWIESLYIPPYFFPGYKLRLRPAF